jgi:hypothetical protein
MNCKRDFSKVAIALISALWLAGLAGCSTSTPANGTSALATTELHFSLNDCKSLGPNLFKCPAVDKPVCSPDYVGTDVQCVRVDKNGGIIIQQMQP